MQNLIDLAGKVDGWFPRASEEPVRRLLYQKSARMGPQKAHLPELLRVTKHYGLQRLLIESVGSDDVGNALEIIGPPKRPKQAEYGVVTYCSQTPLEEQVVEVFQTYFSEWISGKTSRLTQDLIGRRKILANSAAILDDATLDFFSRKTDVAFRDIRESYVFMAGQETVLAIIDDLIYFYKINGAMILPSKKTNMVSYYVRNETKMHFTANYYYLSRYCYLTGAELDIKQEVMKDILFPFSIPLL